MRNEGRLFEEPPYASGDSDRGNCPSRLVRSHWQRAARAARGLGLWARGRPACPRAHAALARQGTAGHGALQWRQAAAAHHGARQLRARAAPLAMAAP